ncbi:MAG: sterol desaturase family protein [Bacteroidia bacterium]|nr:sterol desaturase family protein [Bacteroidia bacterium]
MGGLEYAGLIVPVLLLLVLLEYWVSKRKGVETYRFDDTIVNIYCGVLERLFDAFWVVMMYFVFGFLFEHATLWQFKPGPLTFVAGLFLGDFLAYWHHRLSHEINVLWAGHIVHHQSEELNLTTVFRVSAFSVINRSFFWIWMPILGFDPVTTTSVIVFIGLFQFLTHTRLVGKLGVLEYIFVTPSHHRVHHARNEKYLDKNYGHVFIIWDRMLGTFIEEDEEPDYGITTGFESHNPYEAYLFYWKDLFRRSRAAHTWQDKIRVFIAPPTWNPEGVTPPPILYHTTPDGQRIKSRDNTPVRLRIFVLTQIIPTILALVGILSDKRWEPTGLETTMLTIFIAISALVHGLQLEQRIMGYRLFFVQLVIGLITLIVLGWDSPLGWAGIGVGVLYQLVSLVWLLRMRDYFGVTAPARQNR